MRMLLIEDDPDLGAAVVAQLQSDGHQVAWCTDLAGAESAAPPQLALLDLKLPDGDGLDLLRRWRQQGASWPVIVLTARDQVRDRISGLRLGADDYLVKPFDLDELLARIQAVARRANGAAPSIASDRLQVDADSRRAWRGSQRFDLTRMEWAVLACLAGHRGRIYSRSEIEARLQAEGLADSQSNSLEVVVSRLRRKLGAESIRTHRGLGYRLE